MTGHTICSRCGYSYYRGELDADLSVYCPRCLSRFFSQHRDPQPSGQAGIATQVVDPALVLKRGATFRGLEIIETLGHGGMGVVYKARQVSLNRLVALKVIHPRFATSELFSARFEREARVLASLNHSNVVQVYDFGREGDTLYLIMEYVEGKTLEEVIEKEKPRDLARFLGLVKASCRGLQKVHEAGLVHRDIKPANILIDQEGTAKISDFGLALETEGEQRVTAAGEVVGTPDYMSPEQVQGKTIDGRSDLYAMGVILFQGIAGRTPFHGPTPTATLLKHVNEPPPSLAEIAPDCPRAVQEIVRKLLSKDPATRHISASALEADLSLAFRQARTSRRIKANGTTRMRRFAPLFAAAAILLGVLGLFAVVKLTSSSSDNRDFTTLAKPPLEVVRSYLTTAKQRLFKNDYDGATSALSEAESILEAEPDGIALLEVGAMKEEISFSSAEYARLSSSGDVDEEEYGRFLCFVKGDWDKGLEVLVKKGKSPLKELAELDLRNPSGVKGRIAVADGWYEVGAKEESKRRQGRIWDRAFAWYQAVLPDLVGAERTRVTERIESLDETLASRQTVDLIGLLNPDKFSIRGKFLISRARVLTPGGTGHARMEVPYLPPDEYDLTVVAERKSGSDYLYFGVVAAGRQIGFALDKGATHSLVESTDASHSKPLFPKGKRVSLTFAVRESSLTVTAEGSEIFRIDPRGPFLRDGIVPEWSVNHPNVLFFGSHHSQFEIRKMTLQVVPGLGGRAFPADVTPLATRRTLDLLASVDPARDAVGGEWSLRGGALVSDGSRYARLQVPYHPPEEYDFTITFSREGAGQDVAQIATRAERAFNWDMAGNRDTFGFGLVGGRWTTDSDNPTVVKVAGGLDSKRSYMSVLKVRKSGVSACLEGRLITQWKAGDPELSVNPDWKLADPKRLGLGNWHSPTVYHRIEVTELSGPGTLLRKPLRKVGAGGVPIDLLKLVRPVKDAIKGNFGLDGNVLVTPHGIPWARLETPYEPPAEYDLTLEIERVTGTNALVLGLAADGVQFPVYLHGRIGRGVPLSGIDSASGKRFYENETTYTGPVLDLRKRTTVECEVRTTGVRVVADGKELFDWKGDYHALSVREDWRVPRKRVLFIGSYESLFRISRATLIPRSLGGRVPGKSPLDGRSIDLLARIDAEKDAIAGIFERKGNVILTPHRTSWARLQVKAKWPREYDLRLRVERDEGEDSFNIVPVWNGRKFSISIDAHGPTQHDVTGLDFIDKKEFFRNETTTQGPFLLVGRESTIVISIRRTHITLTIDGREIFTWRGNPSRLSIPAGWKVPDANGLSLGSYDSRFKIKEFTLIPLREW